MPDPSRYTPEQLELARKLSTLAEKSDLRQYTQQKLSLAFGKQYAYDPVGFCRECITWHSGENMAPYQEEILASIPIKKRIAVRSPHGAGKCLAHGEKVPLADGTLVPVEALIGQQFEVIAVDEQLGRMRTKGIAADNGVCDVVEITTEKGRVIRRTLNHPVWSDGSPYHWDDKQFSKRLRPVGTWTAAGDLGPGAAIAVALGNPVKEPAEITNEEIMLAAYLLGDGGLTGQSVMFSQQPGVALNEFRICCRALGCHVVQSSAVDYRVTTTTPFQRGRWGMPVNPVKERLRSWGMMGKSAWEKDVPDWVWQLDDRQLALFSHVSTPAMVGRTLAARNQVD